MLRADARHLPLRDDCVDLVVTSPPYWTSWPGPGYPDFLREVTAEIVRVLRPGGAGWVMLRSASGRELWQIIGSDGGVRWGPPGRHRPPGPGEIWGRFYSEDVTGILAAHSRPGDVVLDPCAGSGPVAALAAAAGRTGIGSDVEVTSSRSKTTSALR